MTAIMRQVIRMGMKIEAANVTLIKLQTRNFASAMQTQVLEGFNGEKIISSPHGKVTYPEVRLCDYVWESLDNYSNMTAVVCGVTGRKYTYAQTRDFSNYVARSLLNMGIKQGEVIALVLPNLPETAIAFLCCVEAGVIVTTINPTYTVDEISKQFLSSNTKAVITSAGIAPIAMRAVRKSIPEAKFIVINDKNRPIPKGVIPFDELITKGKTLPQVPSYDWSMDDTIVLPYSSGTTGLPKGVMLTHRNLVASIRMQQQTLDSEVLAPADGTHQEVIPVILPLYHIYGISFIMLTRLSNGSKLVTLPKFTPESCIKLLENHKATHLITVPPMVNFLTNSELAKPKHLENVIEILCGAAPLSESDVEKFYRKFPIDRKETRFCQGYGLTESSTCALYENKGVKFSSIGKPISGCEARIVDPITKKDVEGPEKTGELWIRGPHIMKGYLNNPKATAKTLVDGWLLTGDIAFYDDDLDFHITDRMKELIKVKGFQVAPAELEALLRSHSNVEEAGVIGIPDKRYGEVPKAFVVLKNPGHTNSKELHNFVRGKVSEFKELRGGIQFIDSLPKNPSGKILRAKLKQEYCK